MDEFDLIIKQKLSKNIDLPNSYKNTIKSALNEENKIRKYKQNKFLKIATSICAVMIVCTSAVYAGVAIYEKIWKEPKKIEITKVQGNDYIELDENYEKDDNFNIKNKISEYLSLLNCHNIEIKNIRELDDLESENSYYIAKSDIEYDKGIVMLVDKETNELLYFLDYDYDNNCDFITESEASNMAQETLTRLNIYDSKYSIELIENNNNIWKIKYVEEKNNKYNNYVIVFGKKDNKITIKMLLNNKNSNYENNPIVITEEEAREIVSEKEKELSFSNFEIIECKKGIEKMNTFIYQLENNIIIENEKNIYEVEDLVRNVWIVKVEHNDKGNVSEWETFEYVKNFANKYYYIDATTGEIIGGRQAEFDF